jgi:SNF2 family DNA or RNA helicase
MTGTPLHDKPLDIYGQYRFLDDRIFGTNFESFKARYTIQKQVKPNVYIVVGYKNEDELSNKISSISFSVDESVVKLPAVVEPDPIMVDLCPVARKAYRDMEKELVVDFGDAIGSTIAGSDLSAYVRLQQITSGFLPAKTMDGVQTVVELGNDRQKAFEDLLARLNDEEPVVVFAKFEYDLQRIRESAARAGRPYFEQSGRAHQWREFRAASGNHIIGVQVQSGGAGIDLTRSRYGIYYSHGFSYGDKRQSRKRIHRPGQERTTFLYHIVVSKSIDTKIMRAMKEKRNVDRKFLEACRD